MTIQGALQKWIRSQTGTSLDFNGDMLAYLASEGFSVGTYNERLYLFLKSELGSSVGNLSDLQQQFAKSLGFDRWSTITNFAGGSNNYIFNDNNNFVFNNGNNFIFN